MIDRFGGRWDGLHRLPGAVDQAVDNIAVSSVGVRGKPWAASSAHPARWTAPSAP